MNPQEHPDYEHEKQHLEQTLATVQQWLESNTPIIGLGGDNRSAQESRRVQLKRQEQMKAAQEEAYFGRVDLLEEEPEPDVFYIGLNHIPGTNVFSWTSPLAAALYYRQKPTSGRLLLKRTLEVHFADLEAIRDEYIDPEIAQALKRGVIHFTDRLLHKLLQDPRSGQLREIVATIQKRQYEIIQAPRDKLLLVQGVTGSGKTEVALHRLAYLLYHERESKDFSADNLLILGPNNVFLGYISNVLPTLGERHIPQRTFDTWVVERLGVAVNHEPQEATLEAILNPRIPLAERVMLYRNAQNKGSLQMAKLLERYVDILHDSILAGRQPLVCTFRRRGDVDSSVSRKAQRTVEDMRSILEEVRRSPLNQRIDELKERLVRSIGQELVSKFELNPYQAEELRPEVSSSVQAQVDKYFGDWRKENIAVAYRRLLRNSQLLRQAGSGLFSQWDLELLSLDAPTPQQPFRFDDMAPLLYLKGLIDGHDGRGYDHIVVDEAQDISPLYFKVLLEHSRAGSITALGDLVQGIYPFHGICQWEELMETADETKILMETIEESYRSTKEIIQYANALLQRTGFPESKLAKPVERTGPSPTSHHCNSRTDHAEIIVQLVDEERNAGRQAIAIICKTVDHCHRLSEELMSQEAKDFQFILDQQARYGGKTAVLPSYFAKGMEFDTVILADADADTYPPDELSTRLLYVAITRASHSLHVCWAGTLTPLLDAELPHLELQPSLEGRLRPKLMTIEQYVAPDSKLDGDWCVERLAGADKLELLSDGRIDETVLAVFLSSRERDSSLRGNEFLGGRAVND